MSSFRCPKFILKNETKLQDHLVRDKHIVPVFNNNYVHKCRRKVHGEEDGKTIRLVFLSIFTNLYLYSIPI